MGQKVSPIGFRLVKNKEWLSVWYATAKDFGDLLGEDRKIRKYIMSQSTCQGTSRITIKRNTGKIEIRIHTSRPGPVIGKKGTEIDRLKTEISKLLGGKEVWVEIDEIKRPDSDAQLVADHIARQIERRVSFRRVLKRAIQTSMDSGVQGVKVQVSGRLGGAEIARTEWYKDGRIPLHTIRAKIRYGTTRAETSYGTIGVKVWINCGEEQEDKKGA